MQGVAENAKMLSHLVGGQDVVTDLFAFMNHIGIQGMGLVEATERTPSVGWVIGEPPFSPPYTYLSPVLLLLVVGVSLKVFLLPQVAQVWHLRGRE